MLGMYRYEDYTTIVNSPEEQAVLDDLGEILTVSRRTLSSINIRSIRTPADPTTRREVALSNSSRRSSAASTRRTC